MRKVLFILGIVIAIGSGIGWYILDSALEKNVSVVYAIKDIPEQTIIEANQIEVKQVPLENAPSGVAQSPSQVVNKRLNWPLKAGDPVRLDKIETSTYATSPIANGRLIAFKTDYNGSIAGLARYGQVVDVVLTLDPKNAAGHTATSGYIVTDLFIEGTADASGHILSMASNANIEFGAIKNQITNNSVATTGIPTEIIARVTPRQFLVIKQAESMGTLSLGKRDQTSKELYPVNDTIEFSTSPVSSDFVFRLLEIQTQGGTYEHSDQKSTDNTPSPLAKGQ